MKVKSCKVTKEQRQGAGYQMLDTGGSKQEKSCENCRFARQLHGVPEPMSICCRKEGAQRSWWRVDPADSCNNFEAPHVTQAEIEEIEKSGAKVILLTQGKYAIVDAEDFERLSSYKWCAVKGRRNWYAKTLRRNGMPLAMHRLILGARKGLVVDHIDHNGLNNRKRNLRLCTRRQNNHNQRPHAGKTSRYKGVYWKKSANKFVAQIHIQGKKIWLGYFTDEIEAAKAYDKKAAEFYGEFAYLNFPDP